MEASRHMTALEPNPSAPKISVIIPAYNHESYIFDAVQSVLAQSFENVEIIAIDDGSTDNTLRELETISDQRLTVYRQENQGAARAINRGISLARGEYITILNSDDVYHPRRLEAMSRYLDDNPETILISSLIQPIDASGKEVLPNSGYDYWLEWYDHALAALRSYPSASCALLSYNFVASTSNIFVRASGLANRAPFSEHLAYCHDYEFLLRTLCDESFHLVEEKLLKYRLHPLNTIKENEFLRHLEVVYSIAATADLKDFFADLSAEKRTAKKLFKGLAGNPDINPQWRIDELQDQIIGAHETLKETQSQLHRSLQEVNRQNTVIASQHLQLQEIYRSRGWRLLTRLRAFKQTVYRIFGPCVKWATPASWWEDTDERTYRAEIIHQVSRMKRPKVIHVIGNLLTGGSSRLVVDLFEHLGHKYDQEVIAELIPSPLAYTGFSFYHFSADKGVDDIVTFLREKNTKILHIHYWGNKDTPWYEKFFRAAEQGSHAVIENINTLVPPIIADRVDRYVYVSESAKNISPCVEEKSTVIYPGSNLSLFHRNHTEIPDDMIGMVYRLEPDKLSDDSILPFIAVVKQRPQTRALIVGGGSLLESYRARVESEGVADRFEFTDYVPYEGLPAIYRRFSIFIAPIWTESFGQVSPFAMSMKIPVVGYEIGALPEILGSTECLAKDTEALVRLTVNLLDNRDRRLRIGEENLQRVTDLFSVEAMVKKYDELYAAVLND